MCRDWEREKETGQVQRSSRPPRLLQLAMLYRNVSWGWYTGCWSPRSAVRWLPPRPPSKCQSVNSPLSRLLSDETLLVSLCKTFCFDAFTLLYGLCKCDATWMLQFIYLYRFYFEKVFQSKWWIVLLRKSIPNKVVSVRGYDLYSKIPDLSTQTILLKISSTSSCYACFGVLLSPPRIAG